MTRLRIEKVISDITGAEIADGKSYEASIRHPSGRTQRVDLSEEDFKALGLDGKGSMAKRRGIRTKKKS